MTPDDLRILIQEGEGTTLELKESLSSSFARELVALANTIGGKILLGVRDDNRDGEKRHRLAVRGAWFLGKTREERRTYFDTLRFVYDYASAVIHGGTPKAKEGRDITKDIALAQDLCRNAILLMAQAEKRPDWSDVILGLGQQVGGQESSRASLTRIMHEGSESASRTV